MSSPIPASSATIFLHASERLRAAQRGYQDRFRPDRDRRCLFGTRSVGRRLDNEVLVLVVAEDGAGVVARAVDATQIRPASDVQVQGPIAVVRRIIVVPECGQTTVDVLPHIAVEPGIAVVLLTGQEHGWRYGQVAYRKRLGERREQDLDLGACTELTGDPVIAHTDSHTGERDPEQLHLGRDLAVDEQYRIGEAALELTPQGEIDAAENTGPGRTEIDPAVDFQGKLSIALEVARGLDRGDAEEVEFYLGDLDTQDLVLQPDERRSLERERAAE